MSTEDDFPELLFRWLEDTFLRHLPFGSLHADAFTRALERHVEAAADSNMATQTAQTVQKVAVSRTVERAQRLTGDHQPGLYAEKDLVTQESEEGVLVENA